MALWMHPPLIKVGCYTGEQLLVLIVVQGDPLPKDLACFLARQDAEHFTQHVGHQATHVVSHCILRASESPHRVGVALKTGNFPMKELPHHHGHCHPCCP